MKTMPAGVFKTNCLAVMDEVKAKREAVVITKHGKPVAMLVPVKTSVDDYVTRVEKVNGQLQNIVLKAYPNMNDPWHELHIGDAAKSK